VRRREMKALGIYIQDKKKKKKNNQKYTHTNSLGGLSPPF
jgi:hypothetical protein